MLGVYCGNQKPVIYLYQQKETTGAHPHKFKDMTQRQQTGIRNSVKELINLIDMSERLTINSRPERALFLAIDKAIEEGVRGLEDEVNRADMAGQLSQLEYHEFWTCIDNLRKQQ